MIFYKGDVEEESENAQMLVVVEMPCVLAEWLSLAKAPGVCVQVAFAFASIEKLKTINHS